MKLKKQQFEEFAKKFGKEENEEMRMYFIAGWEAAYEALIEYTKDHDYQWREYAEELYYELK